MEALGVAFSAVALLASLSTAIDGYLVLDKALAAQDDSHWLALRYGFEKQRLECWRQEVQKPLQEGQHQLDVLPPVVKKLIKAALVEIHITHQEIDKIVAKHQTVEVDPSTSSPVGQLSNLTLQEETKYWKRIPKAKVTWIIRDKDKFTEKVDKLEKAINYLYEILGMNASRTASLALSAYTVAQTSQKPELEFFQSHSKGSKAQNERLVSNCAGLKLANQTFNAGDVPVLQFNNLDPDFPERMRSMAFYKTGSKETQRVLVEWKIISSALSIEDRKRINSRIRVLGALLHLPKEPDFHVPTCIGLCADPENPLRHGYIYATPSIQPSSNSLLSPTTLAGLLEAAKKTGTKALLGERFKLAHSLASSFALLHSAGWLHKGLRANNILFFSKFDVVTDALPVNAMRIVGFDYARPALQDEQSIESFQANVDPDIFIYQHPRIAERYRKLFDIYSLGVVLFEIALWRPLKTKFPSDQQLRNMSAAQRSEALISATNILGGEVGDAYRDAVKTCLTGNFGEEVDEDEDLLPRAFLLKVVNVLETCKA